MQSSKSNLFQLAEKPYCSIQGEGRFVGIPMIFVRLMGCDVGCSWCDSYYTWGKQSKIALPNKLKTPEMLVDFDNLERLIVEAGKAPNVWITGGEPMLQANVIADYLELRQPDESRVYHICTAGTIFNDKLADLIDYATVDIKAPSSGTRSSIEVVNKWSEYPNKGEFKMVVANSHADKDFAQDLVSRYPAMRFTLQPTYVSEMRMLTELSESPNKLVGWSYASFAQWVLDTFEDNPLVRMGIQLHKIIYPNRTRGI